MNWWERLALVAYSAILWTLQPFLRAKLARRARAEPGYAELVNERFGRYADAARQPDVRPTLWVHAVSLGETRAAGVLIQTLRQRQTGLRLLLTHSTATGRQEGMRWMEPGDCQAWLPWDTPGAVKRFLVHFAPTVGLLMETEVWPGLVHACNERGVPLMLVNARLNVRSHARAHRLSWLSRPAYAGLAMVGAQTEDDAMRLRSLGARNVEVWGNLKFDARPDPAQLAKAALWRQSASLPVVMLASSREGEEVQFLDAIRHLPVDREDFSATQVEALPVRNQAASVQWLVVPRHPQRFDEVAALIEARGFRCVRRSTWGDALPSPSPSDTPTIWLGDTLGEMSLYYALSSVALLGGSFEPLGGQNLIEAAACGCPVVLGPHTFNFSDAAEQALMAGAAVRVTDMDAAVRTAAACVEEAADAPFQADAAGRATGFARSHAGAASRTADEVLRLLGPTPSAR